MPSRLVLLLPFALFVVGCGGQEEIRSYKVPKPADEKKPAAAEQAGGAYRILGAMFPADDPQWFFKATGKADELAAVEREFDTFLAGVRFPNGMKSGPLYDLPPGWTSAGKSGMRFDTLKFGPGGKFEMSVIPSVGGVSENVKRWAGQVGADVADVSKVTREVTTTGGVKGLRVDLTGPKNPAGAMPPFMGGR